MNSWNLNITASSMPTEKNGKDKMEKYIIGVDSGTTSIKAVLFDLQGNEVDKKAFPLTGIFPEENRYEEDMSEIWGKASLCIKEIAAKYPRDSIIGIGITAQGDGIWLVDEHIEPVRNGICFCDGRAVNIVERWVESGVCDELFKLTGTRVFTGNQNAIVKWMDENERESLEKAKYFLHLKDYLYYKLTGELTTDSTDQSVIFVDQNTRQSSPRLMVFDTSLMIWASGASRRRLFEESDTKGHIVESAVGAHLLARGKEEGFNVYWWRDRDKEVDFVLERGSALTAIEVKSGAIKHTGGSLEFQKRYPRALSFIVGSANCGLEEFLEGKAELFK